MEDLIQKERKKGNLFLLVAVVNPRWVDGRVLVVFQPIFDVVEGKYEVLFWWVSKSDESRRWELGLKSNN